MITGRTGFHVVWLVLCVGLSFLILWLALMPAESAPSGLGWDKLNHAGAMAVATGLSFMVLQRWHWGATAALLYGSLFGVAIEVLQGTMTTSRSAEWGDVAADLFGAGCAWAVIRMYQRRAPQRQ